MKPFVTVFTLAYNAEEYLGETIESVLNQDEPNIEYVIRDNGSTDRTYEIMQEYAKKDSRIRLVQNKVNYKNEDGTPLRVDQYCPVPQGEYFAFVDSDDLLKPDFISVLYWKAKKCNADIVIGGTTMFDDKSRCVLGERIPPEFIFRAGEKMSGRIFKHVYASLRPLWGKLYRTDFFHEKTKEAWEDSLNLAAGGDTLFSLFCVEKAETIISVSSSLHVYRVKEYGDYRTKRPDIRRIGDGEYLFFRAIRTLSSLGLEFYEVSDFLQLVYIKHMEDLLLMCRNSAEMTLNDKYKFLEHFVMSPLLETLTDSSSWEVLSEKKTLYENIWPLFLTDNFAYDRQIGGFLQKIVFYLSEQKEIPKSIQNLYLIRGVFAKENTYFFGRDFLGRVQMKNDRWSLRFSEKFIVQQKALVDQPIFLREFIIQNVDEDMTSCKEQMLDMYDAGKTDEAMRYAMQILAVNPVDREGLYFGIVTAYQMGKKPLLDVLLDLGETFWCDSEEMYELIRQVDRKSGMEEGF
jgi:glycosyltransferase involved in cell wall biosynthesis